MPSFDESLSNFKHFSNEEEIFSHMAVFASALDSCHAYSWKEKMKKLYAVKCLVLIRETINEKNWFQSINMHSQTLLAKNNTASNKIDFLH